MQSKKNTGCGIKGRNANDCQRQKCKFKTKEMHILTQRNWHDFIMIKAFTLFYKNIFYKNIKAEICEILRIF